MPFFLYPVIFFGSIFIGASHAMTPFGLLLILPVLAMLAGVLTAQTTGNRNMTAILSFAACFGSWLSLLVVFLSSFVLPVGVAKYYYWETVPSVARAGLPFPVVEIPPPPLGSDIPPSAMWPGILANHVFWLAFGVLMAWFFIRRNKKIAENMSKSSTVAVTALIALIATLSQIGLFTIWFD